MKIRISAITDAGKERENNEDAYIFCTDLCKQDWTPDETGSYVTLSECGALAVVADGMGGANAGEVASGIAVDTFRNRFTPEAVKHCIGSVEKIQHLLCSIIKAADHDINAKMWESPETAGMGTTAVACWLLGDMAHVAWCGDSRCYVYHPLKGLRQLTKDHSLVQEMIDRNEITEREALVHPDSNIITRGLGDMDDSGEADVFSINIKANDTFLLCSDGLCGYCSNRDIEKTLQSFYTDTSLCSEKLLKLAMDAGGHDNICIVVVSVIDDHQSSPDGLSFADRLKLRLKLALS